jgi:hypothetical protein
MKSICNSRSLIWREGVISIIESFATESQRRGARL